MEGAEPRGEGNAVGETHANRVALFGEKRLVGDRLDPGQGKLVRVPPAFDQVRDLQRRVIEERQREAKYGEGGGPTPYRHKARR
jgi:hypothetical protein